MPFAALLVGIGAIAACGGDPGAVEVFAPDQPETVPATAFEPLPLRPCERVTYDGIPADKRSLFAMIAALGSRGYSVHQVSPAELQIFSEFRNVHGITVAWRIRFGGDGAGEISLPETMPPQTRGDLRHIHEWGRGLAAAFDKLKCRDAADLRRRCERLGFSF